MSGSKRVGEELVERLARFVESLPDDAANSLQASSASTERAARKADVMPTAVTEIAQACANAICDGRNIEYIVSVKSDHTLVFRMTQEQVAVRIAKTLNAINETQGEGTKPNA